jgi:hypothetical protein
MHRILILNFDKRVFHGSQICLLIMSLRLSSNNLSRKNGEGTEATEDLSDPSVNPAIFNRYKRFFFIDCNYQFEDLYQPSFPKFCILI